MFWATLVASLETVTLALGTTAPELSLTVPTIVPDAVWLYPVTVMPSTKKQVPRIRTKKFRGFFLPYLLLLPIYFYLLNRPGRW